MQFAVVVNSRNSQKLERLDMIKTVAENVELLEAGHKVDLGKPDRTIIIELAKVRLPSQSESTELTSSELDWCIGREGL